MVANFPATQFDPFLLGQPQLAQDFSLSLLIVCYTYFRQEKDNGNQNIQNLPNASKIIESIIKDLIGKFF